MRPLIAALLIVAPLAALAQHKPWSGIGRPATASEIRAWDIDVRADFKGLPPGSGSVAKGQDIWEAKCASCHGTFGESNEVFTPIAGGTTKKDIESGRVANLRREDFPQRTTLMKLSQIATLWDYTRRAMPWNAPKSLSDDEVYAVVAYMLNLGDIVPNDFVLSDKNIAEVQKKLPNRNGKVRWDGMWSIRGKPDVQGDACMTNCRTATDVRSILPDHARNAHGNLAEQQRLIGPQRGADTTRPPLTEPYRVALAKGTVGTGGAPVRRGPLEVARDANCMACHGVDKKVVGPSFRDIQAKYKSEGGAMDLLSGRVKNGVSGIWGPIPMPPHPEMSDEQIRSLVRWILDGAG